MYPNPLKAVIRNLTENVVIASTPFTRMSILNFGARMTLFKYDNEIIVWSAIPYGDEVVRALKQLNGTEDNFNVTHIIIPDSVHTMAVDSFRKPFPKIKVIGMDGLQTKVDYVIDDKLANKLIDKTVLSSIGVQSPAVLNNFEFVYIPQHQNRELLMFDKNSKFLCQADLLLMLGPSDHKLEQYSEELGYKKNFNPHGGLSYLTRFSHPGSKRFKNLVNKITKTNLPEVQESLKIIYNWDFTSIIPCHGNVEENGKAYFKKYFDFL